MVHHYFTHLMTSTNTQVFPISRILLVESNEAAHLTIREILEEAGFEVEVLTKSEGVKARIVDSDPDLVLLNPEVGAVDGFQLTKELSEDERTQLLPVVFLTSLRDASSRRKAFVSGAADIVFKPFESFELLQRIRRHIRLHELDRAKRDDKIRLEQAVAERTGELREANLKLAELNRRVSAMDRAKSSFLKSISHELRTPANGFFGATELLLDESEGHDPELVQLLEESRERLIKLMDDAALLVRLRADAEPEELSTGEIHAELNAFVAKLNLDGEVLVDCAQGGDDLRLDRDLFEIAVSKLLRVAFAFSASRKLHVRTERIGDAVLIRIRSEQARLPAELAERFFDDFAVEESDVPNGWVGLEPTIAYEAARGMGARVSVAEVGDGAVLFELELQASGNRPMV